jgi:hypothetical protein
LFSCRQNFKNPIPVHPTLEILDKGFELYNLEDHSHCL